MNKAMILILGAVLLMPMADQVAAVAGDAEFQVGTAEVEITPPLGMPMSGYAARKETANGVWDPLWAKALVMNDGKTQAAIVVFDLIFPPPHEIGDRIRSQAKEKFGIDMLLLPAIHTHAGPVLNPDLPTPETSWLKTVENKTLDLIAAAQAAEKPATVSIGYGTVDIAYDRRKVKPDGTVEMLWRNPERQSNTPVDPTVGVVQFLGNDNRPIATLVHLACHPVIFGGDNLKYSAEYPGVLRQTVESQLGGKCFFLQGAAGDVNPYYAGSPPNEQGYALLREVGTTVGKAVVRIASAMTPVFTETPTIQTLSYYTEFKYRFDAKLEVVKKYYIEKQGKEQYEKILKEQSAPIRAETPIVMLGKEIAWIGFPGEFFDDFQVDLRRRSPVKHTFFLGYCNDAFSYFPTIQAAAEGGYGAGNSTKVEVGAGERLVDQAVIALNTMLGRLHTVPDN